MIIAGQLLLADSTRCWIEPGYVRVVEDRIAEVVPGSIPASCDAGGASCLIAPGFIDTHVHLPQFDSIGAYGMTLLDWLQRVIFPAEQRWSDEAFASAMTTRAIEQMLRAGTTGFAAFTTVHHESTLAAMRVAESLGVRALVGQTLMDCEAPAALCREPARLLDETRRTLDMYPAEGRVVATITPRFAVSCSDELLAGCGRLASESGAWVQTHLAENLAECEHVERRFGTRYLNVYDAFGLLTPRTIFAHGIHLDAGDREQIAKAGATIAHCPTANSFLQSGTMCRASLLSAGAKMSLGSDIGAGYERSMVRVARSMIEAAAWLQLASGLGSPSLSQPPGAACGFYQITAGNADALGWDDSGRLRVGGIADLLVVEPDIMWLDGEVDPLSRLLFGWDDRWLSQVWLRGKRVL